MESTLERIYHEDTYADIRRGVYLIRGENVVLLGEVVSVWYSLIFMRHAYLVLRTLIAKTRSRYGPFHLRRLHLHIKRKQTTASRTSRLNPRYCLRKKAFVRRAVRGMGTERRVSSLYNVIGYSISMDIPCVTETNLWASETYSRDRQI